MKEYWDKMERLRKRINRKIHEIHLLRQRAEGMNGSGIGDMPRRYRNHSRWEVQFQDHGAGTGYTGNAGRI